MKIDFDLKISTFLILFLIVLLVAQQILIRNTQKVEDTTLKEILAHIDSLANRKDSIQLVIKTIDKEIIKNEKHYEKMVNTISIMPDTELVQFTRQYLYDFAASRGICIIGTSEIDSGKPSFKGEN